MAHLKLSGVSADGRLLLLFDEDGEGYTVEISATLRRAVEQALRTGPRGDTPPRTEPTMSSTLRPRDIQDRIRSGETPETVATAAGTTVEAIMPFVVPVLAEREHVAQRAQRSSVRRTAGEGGTPGARVLEDAVTAQMRSNDTKPDTVAWDSFRREDGRWTLTATYDAPRRSGTAHFTYDAPGNYVTADDDDARWLIGDVRPEPAAATVPADDLQQARQRRLAAVGNDELPFADDALDLVGTDPDQFTGPAADDAPTTPDAPDEAPAASEEPPAAQQDDPADARHRRPVQKKRGRASVPSWDEIMFGGDS